MKNNVPSNKPSAESQNLEKSESIKLISMKLIKNFMIMMALMIPAMVLFFNFLRMLSYKSLFLIDLSMLPEDAIEAKYYYFIDNLFYVLANLDKKTWVLIILTILLIIIPFAISGFLIATKKVDTKIDYISYYISWFFVIISYFLILIAVAQAFQVIDIFIGKLKEFYILEHPQYCEITLHQNTKELVVAENSSVPYKLIYKKQGIMYFKPNESMEYWKEYESSEIDELNDWSNEHCFKKIK